MTRDELTVDGLLDYRWTQYVFFVDTAGPRETHNAGLRVYSR